MRVLSCRSSNDCNFQVLLSINDTRANTAVVLPAFTTGWKECYPRGKFIEMKIFFFPKQVHRLPEFYPQNPRESPWTLGEEPLI